MAILQDRRSQSNSQPQPSTPAPAQRGGQASLGLFGCGSFTGRPLRPFQALAEEQVRLRPLSRCWKTSQPETATPPAQAKADDTARRVDGLTFGQRKARLSHMVTPPVPVSNAARLANPPTLLLTGKSKAQPLPVAAPITRSERVSVERYLESVERDQEERAAREGTTPTMLSFAAASDMREAFPTFHDDEGDELAYRSQGAGYTEATLAEEGC